jgi:hypothetical protein
MISLCELFKQSKVVRYTGKAWKHHIAKNFIEGHCPTNPNGAGKGGTIFLDYKKMSEYLIKDGRDWYVAELDLVNHPICFEFGNNWMATILKAKRSDKGFVPHM